VLLLEGNPLPRAIEIILCEVNGSTFRTYIRAGLAANLQIDGNNVHLVRSGTHSDLFE